MSLRLIEIIISKDRAADVETAFEALDVLGMWRENLFEDRALFRALVHGEKTERVIDRLEEEFTDDESFRFILFPVEATLPRPKDPEVEKKEEAAAGEEKKEANAEPDRISREELYTDLTEEARLTVGYMVRVFLSAVVAVIGLLQGDVAIVIGAMVIAPLLGPNIALALATTLGDAALGIRSSKAAIAGFLIALAVSFVIGLVIEVEIDSAFFARRTHVGLAHVAVALSAGAAGAMAFTRGAPAAIVGVMVAVALLPPTVVFGILLPSPHHRETLGAGLLLATNIVSINLAGVATFLIQGIRPGTWCEAERAKKASRVALGIWCLLLAILVGVLYFTTFSSTGASLSEPSSSSTTPEIDTAPTPTDS